ncbi:MFS transporter [Streptomyces halstedii]|uniref:MFS transporter n=2 Tax=Streptomyces halstedii TaxID=1944 RepID=A0ABS6TYB8_STRHA|nr:MFS transporter [Streptomyces halstedii]MBV7673277.1 MFS transporter [Streptomyces halstedii]
MTDTAPTGGAEPSPATGPAPDEHPAPALAGHPAPDEQPATGPAPDPGPAPDEQPTPDPAPTLDKHPAPDERTARRRFVVVTFLFWLPAGLASAPMVLLFTERGLPLTAVAGVFAAHALTAAAMELPTGGLSDVLGRRTVLAAAGILDLAALALIALGTAGWVLTLGMALMGAGRALSSGPAEAWYVDAVHARSGPDADIRTGLAYGGSASAAALAAGMVLGGALPWLLGLGPDLGARLRETTSGLVLPLSVPALLGAAVYIAFVLYVLTALREPPRPRTTPLGVLRGVPSAISGGLRLAGRDALIRRLLMTAGAAGTALSALELLTPGRAAGITGAAESGAVLFAGLAAAGFVCSALGNRLAPAVARLAGGSERAVQLSLMGSVGGLLLLAVTVSSGSAPALVLTVAGYALVYLGLGAAGPSENDLLHRRVDASGRATALSVQSLALQLVGAGGGLVVGALPAGPLPWLLAAAALLVGALLWTRRSTPAPAPRPGTPTPPRPGTPTGAGGR